MASSDHAYSDSADHLLARLIRRPSVRRGPYVFSAIGADFILAWGSRPRIRDDNKTVSAESAIHSEG